MPVMEILSRQEPYSHMLAEICKRAVDAADLLIGSNRVLERIGVVSTTLVRESDAPPGIRRGIEYFSKPWKSGVEAYHFQFAANTNKAEEWDDRCVHSISKPETDEDERLVTLQFDYQRVFSSKRNISSLKSSVSALQEVALTYFEDLAQGDMFDANDDVTIK
ncbi:hypothetical protein DF042_23415 [Burkholderia cenocepacia]|nr:hypothetical protein DF042_23415 [Burkholderia cenocepacia]